MGKATQKLLEQSKIKKLPRSIQDSIPYEHVLDNGVIETEPGVLTKSYEFPDINFSIAPDEEQMRIFMNYMDFLNSFDELTRWQITIHNHTIDKRTTMEEMRIPPQKDGLNKYRQEKNEIFLRNISKGKNSIIQKKYLTIAVNDKNIDKAMQKLQSADQVVHKAISDIDVEGLRDISTSERLDILHKIYNQTNETLCDIIDENGDGQIDFKHLEKMGLTSKDIIGPDSFEFTKSGEFKTGEMYGTAMFLENIPASMSTKFMSDLTDITCNMLLSIYYEAQNPEDSVTLVKNQLLHIEEQVAKHQKTSAEQGLGGLLPPELKRQHEAALDLQNDITARDQKLFFVTVSVVLFAETQEALAEHVNMIKSIAGKHRAPIKVLKFQQELGLNTALPLCRNDIFAERLYTTEAASVFIPFTSQELNQKDSIFYGVNQTTNSMIRINRLAGDNFNGLIFGMSGSGKSFAAKAEMVDVILNQPTAQVFVIDPQGEYYPLAKGLHGSRIDLKPGTSYFINPLDLDLSDTDEGDPITAKSDFISSMIEVMFGKGRYLSPIAKTVIDRCVRRIYTPYIMHLKEENDKGNFITSDPTMAPTLTNLQQELKSQPESEAKQIAEVLERYTNGSFNTFSNRTNVKTNARFIVYDIKHLGTGMKELGLFVCLNDIVNRMMVNSKKNIYTWVYIDEFHLLLQNEGTTIELKKMWKVCRKWLGVPTGIMQNTEDLLRNEDTRAIFNNTPFIIMLKEPRMDRQNLAELLKLSDAQLSYITESKRGHGLIYNGKVIIPFKNEFPKDTALYALMTTQHDGDETSAT